MTLLYRYGRLSPAGNYSSQTDDIHCQHTCNSCKANIVLRSSPWYSADISTCLCAQSSCITTHNKAFYFSIASIWAENSYALLRRECCP